MPRGRSVNLPRMTLHAATGQARVRLSGHDVYLGPFGSDEAAERYDEALAAWMAAGRQWPPPGWVRGGGGDDGIELVEDLADAYLRHAAARYVKNGKPTTTLTHIRQSIELLYRSGTADGVRAADFGPKRLREFQRWLAAAVDDPDADAPRPRWSRTTINKIAGVVAAMYRWAMTEELVPVHVWQALDAVPGLERGRAPAPGIPVPRENPQVREVPEATVAATLPHAPPTVAAMVRVQQLGAMRPGEVVWMRPRDLTPAPGAPERVWVYRVPPEVYKLEHRGDVADADTEERLRYLGPRAIKILQGFTPAARDDFYFSPSRAMAEHLAARRAARKTPPRADQTPEARRAKRGGEGGGGGGGRRDGRRYNVASYRRAIERACRAAGVPKWTPNRLRHSGATEIANDQGIHIAAKRLGHKHISTTQNYVHALDPKLIESALKYG